MIKIKFLFFLFIGLAETLTLFAQSGETDPIWAAAKNAATNISGIWNFYNGLQVGDSAITHGSLVIGGNNNTTPPGIELGSMTTTLLSYLDFHSSGTGSDYDARIIANGGNSSPGAGDLRIVAAGLYLNGQKVWTQGNDGAGSGLDADLIRGQTPQWATAGSTIYSSNSGNVGIGTTIPQSKLAVNGTITAKQVVVIQTGWPDFVFDSAYTLEPLSSVEKYIQQNNHLSNIPSTKEIESNGLDLGSMVKKQMQKIEELTLYQINANKRINELEDRDEKLQKEITVLKEEIATLKNK